MENRTQHGYLILADISGYSSFVAKSELEHAHDILSELLELILKRLMTIFSLSKLEGDAIFAYALEEKLRRGETLLELIESTYTAFKDQQAAIHRRTTCQCNACRNIPSLDLKFIAHYGAYIVQSIGGNREMVGNDVNLIHRLLKNHVAEESGWRGYALFTDQALAHVGLKPDGLQEMHETYDTGEINIFVTDLYDRYQTLRDLRRVMVDRSEADLYYEIDYPAPPPVVWDWLNDPHKRLKWEYADRHMFPIFMPKGRTNVGAVNHCLHGNNVTMVETVLDWRPFDYFTVTQDVPQAAIMTITFQLLPTPTGTNMLYICRILPQIPIPMPASLKLAAVKSELDKLKVKESYQNIAQWIIQENQVATSPSSGIIAE
jgi:uncharacterized protein YndB with AHSA1/START domain